MKFGEMIKATSRSLVVSPRHEAWLVQNGNPIYSPEALAFGAGELLKQATPRDRRGTFSASSLGTCVRKQLFTYLGMPEAPISAKTAQIFQNGTFMHIRWQMAGLTEGWLAQAEVPVGANDLGLSGTQDGIAHDGTVVEFKSINSHGYAGVTNFGPKPEHLFQIGTYMVTTGAERAAIVYEDKNTQEYQEHVVVRDQKVSDEIIERAETVWTRAQNHTLPEPLDKCMAGEGYVYKFCPFRNVCLKVKSWEQAEEVAHGHR